MINKYTDPIITNYRFDKVGSRASVPITENLTVNNGFLFLKEIPDRNNVVNIGNLVEVQKPEELDSETKFYIDYNAGIVYFDSKLNGTKINVEYSGIGIIYYPASRIYLEADENHEIVRTLSDIEGQLSSLTNLKNQQERLKQEIEERNGSLNKTIEEAKKIDLSGSVEKAKQAKIELEGATSKADTTKKNLNTQIDSSNTAITKLETSVANVDSKINSVNQASEKADGKITEINSKINEANTAEQKLTTTKNEITTSLSDYEKKSTEIKTSIAEVDSKKTEIEESIGRANTSNDTLNLTIEKSKESDSTLKESIKSSDEAKANIDSSIATYKETEASIKAENEKATKNISDLDTKSTSGKQVIDDLNSATLKSETAKTNLEESNTNAIQTNTELKDTTQTANEAKTSLEKIKNESSALSNELNEENTTAISNIESLKSENQSAKTNITGLQTENQNALSKQETLSSETAKANEAIAKITELITSSTDLKNKLEQIVASGDLDKYITDPKLREILTAYATKDDLSKIDVTSQLADYAKTANVNEQIQSLTALLDNKVDKVEGYGLSKNDYDDAEKEKLNSSIRKIEFYVRPKANIANLKCSDNTGNVTVVDLPVVHGYFSGLMSSTDKFKLDGIETQANRVTSLSQLTDDETHRLVTDEEKNKWNNPPNFDLNDYAKKTDLDAKIDKADISNDFKKQAREDKVFSEKGAYDLYNMATKNLQTNFIDLGSRIPVFLSQLTNDTNFKTETEIQEMIANSSKLKKEVVTSLPATGKDDVIYLVKDTSGKDNNSYLEYLWIDSKWELIGSTQVDLSGYVTKEEANKSEVTLRNDFVGLTGYVREQIESKLDKEKDKATISSDTDYSNDTLYTTPYFVQQAIGVQISEQFGALSQGVEEELDKKLNISDLSPFTIQELEEAFN